MKPSSKNSPVHHTLTQEKETTMPQGDKSSYTDKQKRQAAHIEAGYEKKGVSMKNAEARAWATVNKLDGGGKKSGSGRNRR
jgi:plasmid stabilization system protein ParE